MKRLLACLLSVILFLPHLAFAEDDAIPASFKFGADVSTVLSEENSGVVYRNSDDEPTDLFVLLKEAGWDTVRVRVWNDPFDEDGRGYGGGNCGVANAVVNAIHKMDPDRADARKPDCRSSLTSITATSGLTLQSKCPRRHGSRWI